MNDIEQVSQKIASTIRNLQKELESKEEDIRVAAGLGKQLLQQKKLLEDQLEVLKQEKYSLQLHLDAKLKYVENQASEIEVHKTLCDNLSNDISRLKKEVFQINKRYENCLKENEDLKKNIEDLVQSSVIDRKKISSLEVQLEDAKSNLDISKNETNSEEFFIAIRDLQQCKNEKENLIVLSSKLQCELEQSKSNEENLLDFIRELQRDLKEKNDELQSYVCMAEKEKEESSELRAEIEQLKYEQTDINRRGNSVFAEVDDGRKAIQRNYDNMKKRYKTLKVACDSRQEALINAKKRISTMMNLASKKVDMKYVEDMERSLYSARKEIENLCNQLVRPTEHRKSMESVQVLDVDNEYNYLRVMYQQSQKKVEELQKELYTQRMQYLAELDRTMIVQRKLCESGMMTDNLKSEVYKLNVKIDELAYNKEKDVSDIQEDISKEVVKEAIPGFKKEVIPGFKTQSENVPPPSLKPLITTTFFKEEEEAVVIDFTESGAIKKPFQSTENTFESIRKQVMMNHVPRTRKNAIVSLGTKNRQRR